MSSVIAQTNKAIRIVGLFSIMLALATMFSVGSASAATTGGGGGVSPLSSTSGKLTVQVVGNGDPAAIAIPRPVENAAVVIQSSGSDGQIVKGVTDASGSFGVTLRAGQYVVTVEAEGYQPAKQQVTVYAGKSVETKIELTK